MLVMNCKVAFEGLVVGYQAQQYRVEFAFVAQQNPLVFLSTPAFLALALTGPSRTSKYLHLCFVQV
ncbi:MAG: hypothetical protein IPF95_16985 [Flavobacteriales bacterium]|nr:hypothetical protein [Flavobacteriales bacterium]